VRNRARHQFACVVLEGVTRDDAVAVSYSYLARNVRVSTCSPTPDVRARPDPDRKPSFAAPRRPDRSWTRGHAVATKRRHREVSVRVCLLRWRKKTASGSPTPQV
jgi:hypothetical protein